MRHACACPHDCSQTHSHSVCLSPSLPKSYLVKEHIKKTTTLVQQRFTLFHLYTSLPRLCSSRLYTKVRTSLRTQSSPQTLISLHQWFIHPNQDKFEDTVFTQNSDIMTAAEPGVTDQQVSGAVGGGAGDEATAWYPCQHL